MTLEITTEDGYILGHKEAKSSLAPSLTIMKLSQIKEEQERMTHALGTSPTRGALLSVTYLGPAAQVPGHCLAGRVVPHELVILAGHFGQQLLHLHHAGVGEAHKLLRIHRAAESTGQAFAIQEGDYDPDDRGNHGSLHDGGTHVPGAGERQVSG